MIIKHSNERVGMNPGIRTEIVTKTYFLKEKSLQITLTVRDLNLSLDFTSSSETVKTDPLRQIINVCPLKSINSLTFFFFVFLLRT